MARVTIIPSTINPTTRLPIGSVKKLRVAAYARVSTASEEQEDSFEAQVKYYTNYIKSKEEWTFVEMYADEGLSGTSTKKREGFNKMIDDALDGKIDMIIVKSISRFSRNTLDAISYIRKLKEKGVEVFFEKENLRTLESTSEMVITMLASIAQEESRSISQNVTMGKRWAVQQGKVSFAYKNFLGYKKEGDKIVIDEEQAKVVRLIYKLFLIKGYTCTGIANYLKANNYPTASGKNCNWDTNRVRRILTNEKYKGDALLQKTYTVDFLTHKLVKNEGQVPQAYVENSHPAIINKDDWDLVQVELERRDKLGPSYSANSIFASKLICYDCGGFYGRKVWHSGTPYAKSIYRCNCKFDNEHQCKTPNMAETEVKEQFVKAYNYLMNDKARIIDDTLEVVEMLTDVSELDTKIAELSNELQVLSEMANNLQVAASSKEDYANKHQDLVKRFDKANKSLTEAKKERACKITKANLLKAFVAKIKALPGGLIEFDDEVWMYLVENGLVNHDRTITFRFRNGTEVTA